VVIEMTGRSKFTELGGLYKYKYMPLTFWLYMIGAFSISGFPLFNGFVSKTMVVEALAMAELPIVWLQLEGASIGTFLHTGLKVPYLTWFGRRDKDKEPVVESKTEVVKEPPKNMQQWVLPYFCAYLSVCIRKSFTGYSPTCGL